MEQRRFAEPVLVACPDARPPAYQAVVGLHRARLLRSFLTSTYYDRDGHIATLMRRLAPVAFNRLEGVLLSATSRKFRRPWSEAYLASTSPCEWRPGRRRTTPRSRGPSHAGAPTSSIAGWPA